MHRHRPLVALLVLAFGVAWPHARAADPPPPAPAVPSAAAPTPPALRLPDGARPRGYDLVMTVVPGAATVPGTIAIDVELDRPHALLWLNADALDVKAARVDRAGTTVGLSTGHAQFVGITFDPPLPAGRHVVTVEFAAEMSRNASRGVFHAEDGGATYALTHFEPLAARRAFPCFDEPSYKVPWQLALRVPKGAAALANTPVASRGDGGDGLDVVRFERTAPLPSYLVAFAVGPYEFVDTGSLGVRGTPTRIAVPRGRGADAAFAAQTLPEMFVRLEQWFGMPYPYAKLDHVTIPLNVRFAMENVGLITYGMPTLLAPPGGAPPRYRRSLANVGAHEIAHQWFGNLVTSAWWDDIWLNEAFATWMADKTVHAWRPGWDRGAGRVWERDWAIDNDRFATARRIREPIRDRGDISRAFDAITYQKGATVIAMIEGWMGEAAFRRGVQDYLAAHRDGTATSDDFLGALAGATPLPVRPAFASFLDQNGVPRVDVTLACDAGGARVELAQSRLLALGSQGEPRQWQIPVCVRYGRERATREACTLLAAPRASLPLEGGCPAFVFGNAGGRGYYVPLARGDLETRVARHRGALSEPEFASLLLDRKALLGGGAVPAADALAWVARGAQSRARHVELAALELAQYVGRTLVDDAQKPAFEAFLRARFGARARALGLVARPGESDEAQLARRELMMAIAPLDPVLAAEARRLARAWLADPRAIDPGLVDPVLIAAARTGDARLFEAFESAARTTPDALVRRPLLNALFAFDDPALAQRGHALLLDPAFDVRETWTALYGLHYRDPSRRATAAFIAANFDALARTVQKDAPGNWPLFASGRCSEADARAVADFWKDRAAAYATGPQSLASALDAIRSCARLRAQAGALNLEARAGRATRASTVPRAAAPVAAAAVTASR